MNKTKTDCGGKERLARALRHLRFGPHRLCAFARPGNTAATPAFPKDKWNPQLTKNGASLMMG